MDNTYAAPVSSAAMPAHPDRDHVTVVPSQAILGNRREVFIEHHGAFYRLSETRNGKLILTK